MSLSNGVVRNGVAHYNFVNGVGTVDGEHLSFTISEKEPYTMDSESAMDSESTHMVAASKVPMLKPENGNTAPKTIVVEGVEKVIPPTTAEEKAQKRFGGNAATKKTQRNLLKQQYENFTAPSSETIDQTFNRLQKLVSQLEILSETLSQEDEKDGIQFNVDKFENASKSLNKIIENQIVDNYKKGLGYNAVLPPLTGNFMPLKPDLSFTGLEEFTNKPVVIKLVVESSEAKASEEKPKAVRKNNGAPIMRIGCQIVDCNYQRVVKPVWNNAKRVNHHNFAKKTHPCPKKNMVPRAVLIKSGLVSVNTARQNISKTAVLVNTARQVNAAHSKTTVNAARPMSYLSKTAHSTVKRPIHKNTTFKNSNFNQRVNTVKDKNVNTVRPKAVVNAVKGNNINAVKASACWVWKPKTKVLDHVSKHNGNPQLDLQDQGSYCVDSGCSGTCREHVLSYRHEEIDGGYIDFGGNPKGEKITGKDLKSSQDDGSKPLSDDGKKVDEDSRKDCEGIDQEKEDNISIAYLTPKEDDEDEVDRVYKLKKALYGTTSALRAWYETLRTISVGQEFQRGEINKTYSSKGTKVNDCSLNVSLPSSRPWHHVCRKAKKSVRFDDGKVIIREIDGVIWALCYKGLDDNFGGVATTASCLEVRARTVVFSENKKLAAKDVNLMLMKLLWIKILACFENVQTATIPTPRKRTVIAELGTSTTTISSQPSQAKVQDKGKGILVEEPVNPKKKDLIRLDEEIALKLQAELKVKRLYYQFGSKLQAQEQEELTDEEKARFFIQFLKQRRKHFAAKRAEEKRNRPPTRA
ncbi:hypothetical protein Tco_0374538 [Tanacetum coccineum]